MGVIELLMLSFPSILRPNILLWQSALIAAHKLLPLLPHKWRTKAGFKQVLGLRDDEVLRCQNI